MWEIRQYKRWRWLPVGYFISRRITPVCDCSLFHERASCRLRVHEAVSEHEVVFFIEVVLVEVADLIRHVLVKRLGWGRIDGDSYDAIDCDEAVLVAIWVLV